MTLAESSPRWAIGSWQRIIHGLAFAFLQPVVPIIGIISLQPMLYDDTDRLLSEPSPSALLLVVFGEAIALFLMLRMGVLKIGRLAWADLGWTRAKKSDIALGLVGGVVALIGFGVIVEVASGGLPRILDHVLRYTFLQHVLFVIMAICIALFEETVFRGCLQTDFSTRFGTPIGIMITAIIYAAWHPPNLALLPFIVRSFHALLYGVLRWRTGSNTASMIAHALFWSITGLA